MMNFDSSQDDNSKLEIRQILIKNIMFDLCEELVNDYLFKMRFKSIKEPIIRYNNQSKSLDVFYPRSELEIFSILSKNKIFEISYSLYFNAGFLEERTQNHIVRTIKSHFDKILFRFNKKYFDLLRSS